MRSFLKIFIACLIFILGHPLKAQNTFQKTIGGNGEDDCVDLIVSFDGGYVMTGMTNSFGAGNYDVFLNKIDSIGNILWYKTYGGSDYDYGWSLVQTPDSGFIVVGATSSFSTGNQDIYVIRTNSIGDTIWTKTYGTINDDWASSLIETFDGNFVISGNSSGIFLIKIDISGNILWTKAFSSSSDGYNASVVQSDDGGFVIAGKIYSTTSIYDVVLLKTDSTGNLIWNKTFGNTWGEYASSLKKTYDGGYIIAGTNSAPSTGNNIYIIKTDSIGDTLWTKSYQDSNINFYAENPSIELTSDSGYIVASSIAYFVSGNPDSMSVYLLKINKYGTPQWAKKFGNVRQYYGESASSINITDDSGYIIGGYSSDAGAFILGGTDTYIIKTDSNGNCNCYNLPASFMEHSFVTLVDSAITSASSGISVYSTNTIINNPTPMDSLLCSTITVINNFDNLPANIFCYPNPFSDFTTINFDDENNQKCTLIIYDITGRRIREIKNITNNKILIEKNNSPNGLYFFQLSNDREILGTEKFIIE
jgi:hypothetical protein